MTKLTLILTVREPQDAKPDSKRLLQSVKTKREAKVAEGSAT